MTKILNPMDEPIKPVYIALYPDDPDAHNINDRATFRDMMKALRAQIDIYFIIGEHCDTVIRERLFTALAHRSGKTNEWIFNCWILGPVVANKREKEREARRTEREAKRRERSA